MLSSESREQKILKVLDQAEKFEALARCEPDFYKAEYFRSLARDIKRELYQNGVPDGTR